MTSVLPRIVSLLSIAASTFFFESNTGAAESAYLEWTHFSNLPPVGVQPDALGVAGPYVGVHNDALIVAGGANFPKPYWGEDKIWHDDIWVLERTGEWTLGGKLPRLLGYGASVSTEWGVLCLGGNDADRTFNDTILLKWNTLTKQIEQESLPSLPKTIAFTAATKLGTKVYLAGGIETNALSSAMNNFWVLDLEDLSAGWVELPSWPGLERGFNVMVNQHNGKENQIFVFSGRREGTDGVLQFLTDAYAYSPSNNTWKRLADSPVCFMAGTAIPAGENHILVLGGADGSLFHQADELKDKHPGFPKQIWGYNALTDTWQKTGEMPLNHVTTQVAKWGKHYFIASGEVRPRVRTPIIWKVSTLPSSSSFGTLNWITLLTYLGALLVVGFVCARNTHTTDDFYLGGRSIPWWAAGMSIFGTTLSAITYLSLPARVYGTSWAAILLNAGILIVAPLIVYAYIPRLRRINAVTAYQFLEDRFDVGLRLFGSASFIIFQLFRMGIVVFLPALALAAVTGFNLTLCILMMGIIATVYTAFGGIKAVIWTDVIQVIVLIGGALLALGIIASNLDGGFSTLVSVGKDAGKFEMPPIEWSWATDSFMVLILGAIFSNALVPYTSDQAVVQRYLTTSSEKEAQKAVWTNALLAIPATLIFAVMGIALFVFYKSNPELLGPLQKNDQILPWFVAHQMPAGLAGLVIAGVFAAAMSSLDSSMHSICTAVSNDFVLRFKSDWSEKDQLSFARKLVSGLGILGTAFAIILSTMEVGHIFDLLIGLLGLIGSPLAGLFLLGLFVKRAGSMHAWIGVSSSVIALAYAKYFTNLNGLLYGLVGIGVCVGVGLLSSLLISKQAAET
ncbi:MAG: sodium/solute symporter [Verrucomicrobia bacterium]|nr:sodium/solute symporter [Verrucomicrobiota bacterium]MDA1066680.1 sodium/solute symporter [Verrucomicrobiota bacterium]